MTFTLRRIRVATFALATVSTLAFPAANAQNQAIVLKPQTPPPAPEKQSAAVEKHLKTFDQLDFDVFSNQKWDRLHERHRRRQVDPAHGQENRAPHGDHRSLDQRHHGS